MTDRGKALPVLTPAEVRDRLYPTPREHIVSVAFVSERARRGNSPVTVTIAGKPLGEWCPWRP